MSNTPSNGIPYVPQNTMDPAAGLNLALDVIDALLTPRVESMALSTPPVSPTNGQMWIVKAAGTGAWAGHDNALARYDAVAAAWDFYAAGVQAWQVINKADDAIYIFSSGAWAAGNGISDAPSDGTIYGRRNNAWEAVSSGGTGVSTVNGFSGDIDIVPGANITVTPIATTSGATIEISASGSGGSLPWIDVTQSPYNADKTGATDATVAIQAVIDALSTAGGGVAFFPIGVYLISGALQDTSRSNSQLVLPKISTAGTQIPIVFLGQTPPPQDFSVSATMPFPTGCAVLKSTLSSGTGALLGVWGPSGSAADFSNIQFRCVNMLFQTIANPTITALDGSHIACVDIDNVVACTGKYGVPDVTYPTTTASYGIRLPKNGNGAFTRIDRTAVVGFYTGYQLGEHTVAGQINAWACAHAFEHIASDHASHIQRAQAAHCTKGFVPSGLHYLDVAQFDIEHATSGTWNPSYDVDDPSHYMRGTLAWHVVIAGVGSDDAAFTVNGACNLRFDEVGTAFPVISSATSHTLTRHDCNRGISFNASTAVAVTLPLNIAEVGAIVPITQYGSGQVTVAAASGVSLHSRVSLKTNAQYSMIFLYQVALNDWILAGDMS